MAVWGEVRLKRGFWRCWRGDVRDPAQFQRTHSSTGIPLQGLQELPGLLFARHWDVNGTYQ